MLLAAVAFVLPAGRQAFGATLEEITAEVDAAETHVETLKAIIDGTQTGDAGTLLDTIQDEIDNALSELATATGPTDLLTQKAYLTQRLKQACALARSLERCLNRKYRAARLADRTGSQLGLASSTLLQITPDAPTSTAGWTAFTASSDTKVIYVSSSNGSDSNNGLSESAPVKTIAKGYSLMRDGYPDWLLLKKGDTWRTDFSRWKLSGRSSTEPVVFGSYGSGARPLIIPSDSLMVVSGYGGNKEVKHVAFTGLEFYAATRDPSSSEFGNTSKAANAIYWYGTGEDILIEDCKFSFFPTNLAMQPESAGTTIDDVRIRRCVITDAWSSSSHSQGAFLKHIDGLLIEECVFDQNGFNADVSGADATWFNHNVYLKECNQIVVKNNVFARASALGVKVSSDVQYGSVGILVENNLFVANGYGVGLNNSAGFETYSHKSFQVRGNVFQDTGRYVNNGTRGYGIWVISGESGVIQDNLFVRKISGDPEPAIFTGNQPQKSLTISKNLILDWPMKGTKPVIVNGDTTGTGVTISGNTVEPDKSTLVDATRSVESYNKYLGGASTLDDFMSMERAQSRDNWRANYAADQVNSYLKAGFTVSGN